MLVLPGYALVAAFAPDSLPRSERALLSLGLSLAVGAVAGLVLDRLPGGLDRTSWSTILALITVGCCGIAAFRRRERQSVVGAVPALAAVRTHVNVPFYRAGYTLMLNQAVSGALGVVYWLVATRLYSPAAVGENAALITTMILVAAISQLSLKQALTRFVPRAGARTRSLLSLTYVVTIGGALVGGVFFAVLARRLEHASLRHSLPLAAWLVLSVVAWSLFDMEDGVLTGMRRSDVVLVENTVYNVAKIVLLAALSRVSPGYGVLLSWTLPLPAIVLAVNGLIFGRLARRHAATFRTATSLPTPRTIVRSVGSDYAGTLLAEAGTRLLPLLVIARLGDAANAYFYQAWLIATTFYLLALGMAGSFTVEAAADPEQLPALSRRMLVQLTRLLLPVAAVAFALAPWLLRLFGSEYAREGAPLLRWLLAGTLPMIVTTWYVCYARVANRFHAMIAVPGVSAGLTLVLAYLLLPRYGITGAGIAWFASQLAVAGAVAARALPVLTARRAAAARGADLYLAYLDAADELVAIGSLISAELPAGRTAALLERHSLTFDDLRRLASEIDAAGGAEVRAALAAAQLAATRLFFTQAALERGRAERLAAAVREHAAASRAFAGAARRELGLASQLAA